MTETVHEIARQNRSRLRTPYYLLDESRLLRNLEKIKHVRELSGAKSVLALKCFSTWSVFPLMSKSSPRQLLRSNASRRSSGARGLTSNLRSKSTPLPKPQYSCEGRA